MKTIVIFTAIFGKIDILPEQHFNDPSVDFICFTDNNIKVNGWKIIKCPLWDNNPIKTSKMYKIISHKFVNKYKFAIWIDGHVIVKNTILEPLKYLTQHNYDAVFFKHDHVDSLYNEATHLIHLWHSGNKKDTPENIIEHIKKYKDEGFPSTNGLTENTVFWRKLDNYRLNAVMELWWSEVINGSHRDQLSLMYCLWKHNYNNYFLLNTDTEHTHKYKDKYYIRTNHI